MSTRIFLDTEFIENGNQHPIIPISFGLVMEDGSNYYAEVDEIDWSKANEFVLDYVKPKLLGGEVVKSQSQIAKEIQEFVGEKPEFWAYYADYDWVVLCQLYGDMVSLPEGWPKYCLDLKQYMWHLDLSYDDMVDAIGEQTNGHNAMADAIQDLKIFRWLFDYQTNTSKW